MHKGLKGFGREGCGALTKDMDQLCKQTCFKPIYIKYLKLWQNRRAQEAITILGQKSTTTKTQINNGVQWETSQRVVVKRGYFKSHGITVGYFLTATIDAYCVKYIMVMDVTNVFIQTNMTPKKYG